MIDCDTFRVFRGLIIGTLVGVLMWAAILALVWWLL